MPATGLGRWLDILSFTDRWGRTIVLSDEAWSHILAEHAEMVGQESAVDMTVAAPERVMTDVDVPHRLSFYRTGVLPGRYRRWFLKVCAHFSPPDDAGNIIGEIVTAYPTPNLKRGETQLWP